MSKSTYPLKLPNFVNEAAAERAHIEGVSLNQFIAAAVAEEIGTLRTTSEFLQQRARIAEPARKCDRCYSETRVRRYAKLVIRYRP